MQHAKPYYISPAFAFVAYPNRDSTPFKQWYHIDGEGEGEDVGVHFEFKAGLRCLKLGLLC